MRITIAGLRRWIVVLAGLLLAVLAGFFIYARYRFRHIEKDLPARLGIDVQQTANGYTYSQSSQGHTLYTIHASKLIQFKAGHAQLQDVAITLYGPPGSNREDHIYGKNFNYDQNTGVVSADGEVNIDLSGPAAQATPAPNQPQVAPAPAAPVSPDDAQPDKGTIHIRTTGLTFSQKTGDASTSQAVEFQFPRAAGASVGASYNSKTGIVVLDHQVELTSSSNGHSSVVHAVHATLLRQTKQAILQQATSEYETEHSSSDQAVVWFRQDGSADKIDAAGHVRIVTDAGAVIASQTAHMLLDAKSQPTLAEMFGGIVFDSQKESGEKNETMHGTASEGTLNFGPNSLLKHAEFRNAVDFTDRQTGLSGDPHAAATRHLQAAKADVDFVPAGKKSVAHTLLATGHPVATMQQTSPKGPPQSTTVSGDQLLATLDDDGRALRLLDGTGHTRLVNAAQDGSVNTSTGDTLHITFAQPPASAEPKSAAHKDHPAIASNKTSPQPASGQSTSQIETAIQDGSVVMTQTPAKKPGATAQPATTTAWAKHAEYHDADQILHLTGSPRIDDGQSLQLASRLIDYHRDSGDMTAQGDIRATYLQPPQNAPTQNQTQSQTQSSQNQTKPAAQPSVLPGGSGPVHVLADRADLRHDSGIGYFYAAPHALARMWQGENSVWAPVLELHRDESTLKAYGQGTGAAPVVNTNFTSAMGAKHQQSVFRIHSATLLYSDKTRQGDFDGSVTAEDPDGIIHSDHAIVYLKPAEKPGAAPSQSATAPQPVRQSSSRQSSGQQSSSQQSPEKQSQLDHLVATGHVVLTQPGRKGEGGRLVYTAADGKYVLTGTPDARPYLTDRVHGTTTGAALLFNSQDDSVEVSGGKSGAVTDTRTQKK